MRGRFGLGAALAVALCSLVVAACGGSDNSSSGGGGGGSSSSSSGGGGKTTSGAKVIDPKLANGAKGTVTYCQGKDTAGNAHAWVKAYNAKNTGITVKLLEFPASADAQRQQFIQRQQAKSGDCDIFSSDVIWTAEFASQKWIYDMTPVVNARKSEFIGAPLETVHFENKYFGVPETTDAGFLYYNDTKIKSVPSTWQQVYQQAASNGGIVYQGAAYEGLTCDYLELLFASGGQVLNGDGTKAAINSPQATKALQLMVDGIKNGAAPKAVTTYMEPESLAAWETGKYAFMRNWPYAYAASNNDKGTKIKGKFKVTPQPSFEGGGKGGVLGGHNSVISVYSKNPGAALAVVNYVTGTENNVRNASQFSLAPVLSAAYDDAKVKKALPFSDQLKQAVAQAHARPVSPVYPQISQAIYNNVNDALAGRQAPAAAVKKMQSAIDKALSTF
ncbi:MAG: trehalose/maltose transport system substrate-binding protein [Solirubrobacteraceae bacterium]|jgi:multiple sugar transport system substrate-binding protein|nr:trehalose/maltose transport system substrate-binding protein [Solirubrobacteraceae bacterium]